MHIKMRLAKLFLKTEVLVDEIWISRRLCYTQKWNNDDVLM